MKNKISTVPDKDIYLSIIIPLFNEEQSIEMLLDKIIKVGSHFKFYYEIILIDDGSTDSTWDKIEQLKKKFSIIKGIKLRRNFGQTNAMVAGFDNSAGEILVTMDGDIQNDPADIPVLLEKLKEGYDIVSGWRLDRKDHFTRVVPSKVANGIISLTTGVNLHDYGCSLKAYRSECIKSIQAYGEMHRFFPALASMTGARVTEVPVNHHPRRYGKSKYGLNRIFKVFSDIFSMNLIIRFSATPLKGFAICAIPFLFMTLFFSLLSTLAILYDWTAGKATFFVMAAALTAMAVGHLIFLGIIGELVVSTSDLSHTQLPEITKREINIPNNNRDSEKENEVFSNSYL